MAHGSSADVAAKWSSKLAASGDSIKAGVMGVTQAPGVKAAAAANLWQQRVIASKDKWTKAVGAVSLADWQTAMIDKGLPRIASGAQAAQPKMQTFLDSFLPHVDRVAATVRGMAKGGIEESIARAAAQIRGNAQYRKP